MEKTGSKIHFLPLFALATVPLIMVLGNSMLIPILPTMQETIGITKNQSSLVITMFSVPAGVIIPLAGFLSDRYSRKVIIVPALLLYGAGGVVAGLAAWLLSSPYWLIMVGRVLQGLGAAGTAPIAMALAGDLWKGASRAKALGLIEASNGLGKVLSPIFGVLLAMLFWYAAFFAFPIICILSAALVYFFVKEPKKTGPKQQVKQYLNTLKGTFKKQYKFLLTAYFAGAVALFTLFGFLFYIAQILEEVHKIDGLMRGFILSGPLLAMATTSYITGTKIKKNYGLMKTLILVGLALITLPLVINAFLKNPYVELSLLVVSGVGTGLMLPCLNTMITSSVKTEERGAIVSLYGSVRFLGVAAGPPIFGALMDTPRLMYLIMAGLSALCFVACWMWIAVKKQDKGGGDPYEKIEWDRKLLAMKKARA
ncbi:MFS transporter [Tumebacillus permanentifrigoris]|uniref:ACDE family multidrug resistance protein n=1 Tax=Tumebacillus permanentifrigoris TaxID=378543 RepID=A0A316DAL3_9BACL|nr:MFS transporter [Tumebacillus permanentifrigoris]PWK14329.1 ACDE family multidrug resistance protein [Tumebacillus permanentifrigoris]